MLSEEEKTKKLIISIIMLLISIMIFSGISLYQIFYEDKEQEKIFNELSNIIEESNVDDNKSTIPKEVIEVLRKEENSQEQEKKPLSINELYKINNDIVAYLKIEDTNISYPIMQTKNNANYYLKRNFYKQYSSLGTPYLAENCEINVSDNLLIHGHHINGNKLFGELEKYKSKVFYNNHSIIKFTTLQEEREYKIIAVFKTIADTGFRYNDFCNAENEEQYNNFIQECKTLSMYDTKENAEYGEQLLTLNTCEYSNKNGRLVVVAKRIN